MDYRAEYGRLLDLQVFREDELDYSALSRYVELLSTMAEVANSGISVFDLNRRNHPFVSRNFGRLFKYDLTRIDNEDSAYFDLQIHPSDFERVMRSGVIALRFCMENPDARFDFKLVNEYRIMLSGKYVRVIEQTQLLEEDRYGNIWFSLSALDVSPNQSPLGKVESKMMNFKTGEVMPLPKYPEYEDSGVVLTLREVQVLQFVREGYLSKEISDKLKISVHTVNTYRQRIIGKLDVSNSVEAIRLAVRLGLME